MPPEVYLRPLSVDLFYFLWPILVGVGAFFLGRFFHRWSITMRAGLVSLAVTAILVVAAHLFHFMPRIVEIGFSYVGGVMVFLCWMIMVIIGISWAESTPEDDTFTRSFFSVLPLFLIGMESGGSLWFRFQEPET